MVTWLMTSRDPEGAVRQYGRLSYRQLGFLLLLLIDYAAATIEINWWPRRPHRPPNRYIRCKKAQVHGVAGG